MKCLEDAEFASLKDVDLQEFFVFPNLSRFDVASLSDVSQNHKVENTQDFLEIPFAIVYGEEKNR